MEVYVYKAELFCKECGEAIRRELTAYGTAPVDIADEYSYDSDDFPKGPFPNGGGESDVPCHCACGMFCLNAMKVGVWLENDLTHDGVSYVMGCLEQETELAEFWGTVYSEVLEWT